MISPQDLKTIQKWAKRYNIHSVYLFGSSLSDEEESNDIDLGIEGIPKEHFFKLTGELDWMLSKSIDVVDLDSDNPFAGVVRKYGRRIYG
ncbi:MAG: nucleotidyltransferase domain-containing protein [bacterium]